MAPAAGSPPPLSSGSRILSNVLHLAAGQATATAAALVWLYFVPRIIGPTGMGENAIAISVIGLLSTLLNPGVGVLLTRDIARRPERAGSLVGSGILIRLAGLVPAAAFIVLYNKLTNVGPQLALIIWLAGLGALVSAVSGVIQSAFNGLEQMQYLAYASALGNGLVRIAGIAVVLAGLGVLGMMQANAALCGLVLVLNLLWMRKHFVPNLLPNPAELRYVLAGSLTFWAGGLIFRTYLWIDTVILSAMAPISVVGWYNTPTQIFTALLMLPTLIGSAWFPRLARAFNEGTDSLRAAARPPLELMVMLSLPVAAGLAAVAPSLVWTLYGASFHGAVWPLIVLAFTVIPTFFNMLSYQALLASNRQAAWIRLLLVVTPVNIVSNVVLIGWFQAHFHNGAAGAALSLLMTEVIQSVCAICLLPGVINRPFLTRLGRGVLAAAMMAGLVLLTAHEVRGRLGLVIEITVGVVSFGGLALLLRLPGETEMTAARAVWARVGPRRSSVMSRMPRKSTSR